MPEQTLTIWRLFSNTGITREKNRYIEDIDTWLTSTFIYRSHSQAQYFKHALKKTLKINVDQDLLNFFENSNNIDYVSVKNPDDTYPVYYFVDGKKWIAEKTVQFDLTMDTIQNFTFRNYELSEKTTILRQHENRFLLTTPTLQGTYMRRKIDRVNEGLPEPVLYKVGKTNVKSEAADSYSGDPETTKMYLIYAYTGEGTMTDASPVSCLACFDTEKTVYTLEKELNLAMISDGNCYIIMPQSILQAPEDKVKGRILLYNSTYQRTLPIYVENGVLHTYQIRLQNSLGYLYLVDVVIETGAMTFTQLYEPGTTLPLTVTTPTLVSNTEYFPRPTYWRGATADVGNNYNALIPNMITADFTKTAHYVKPIYGRANIRFGRDDPRIQKIIELPYPVISKDDQGDYTTMGTSFIYNGLNEFLEIDSTAFYSFKKRIYHTDLLYNVKKGFNKRPLADDLANIENESKLFNSQFDYEKFVYDTAAKPFRLENYCYIDQAPDSLVYTYFIPTTTGNSKMAFKFAGAKEVGSLEDYEDTLVASRNNQASVFNNSYFNYMKMGYNYDKEQRTRQTVTSGVVSGLQLIGAIAAFAASPATGGASAAAGVALATGAVASVVSTTANYINSEAAQEQKMRELQNQAGTMGSADDLDLINAISGNKANIIHYRVSDNVRNALYTLFRFYGYKSNKRGNPLNFSGNGNERQWYNFVQCEPVYAEETNLSEEILNDITQRYKDGVTFFHKHNIYDFTQHFENWETFLIGHRDPDDPAPTPENPLDDMFENIGTLVTEGGHWLMTPPVYGDDTTMEGGQMFRYIVFKGNTSNPSFYFEATDAFGNSYKFEPGNGKCVITMTRLMDGRTFTKELVEKVVWKLSGAFTTLPIPGLTTIAEPFEFSLEAQYI